MLEEADYQQLLVHLEEDRQNIERLIVWVKGRMQQSDAVQTAESAAVLQPINPIRSTSLAPDTFFRLSVPDAIKKYFNIVKRPRTAKDITTALDSGGLTHHAKSLYATVYPTLLRMERAKEVVRVGKGEWAPSEWYPVGRKANQVDKTESEG